MYEERCDLAEKPSIPHIKLWIREASLFLLYQTNLKARLNKSSLFLHMLHIRYEQTTAGLVYMKCLPHHASFSELYI